MQIQTQANECRMCNAHLSDGQKCTVCGYITVGNMPDKINRESLVELKPWVPTVDWDNLQINLDQPESAAKVLQESMLCLINELLRRCKADRIQAVDLLMEQLKELDNGIWDLLIKHGVKSQPLVGERAAIELPTLQALFLALDATGGLEVPKTAKHLRSAWAEETWKIAELTGKLAMLRRGLRRGVMRVGLAGTDVNFAFKENVMSLLLENSENRFAYESSLGSVAATDEMLAPKEASEVIRDTLGFDFQDMQAPYSTKFAIWEGAREDLGAIVLVDPAKLDNTQRNLVTALLLDFATVRQYKDPFWFRLAPKRELGGEGVCAILADACVETWTHFFPILRVRLLSGNLGGLLIRSTYGLSMSIVSNSKARIMNRVIDMSTNPKTAVWRQRAHQRLEGATASVFESRGWKVVHNKKRYFDTDLSCGEIDVLCGHRIGDKSLVVLGEVKDFDVSIDRNLDFVQHGCAMENANAQLRRKREWIESNRGLVEQWLGVSRDFACVNWVIGTRYIAPPFAGRFPLIPIAGLDRELARLEQGVHRYWWKPHV